MVFSGVGDKFWENRDKKARKYQDWITGIRFRRSSGHFPILANGKTSFFAF